ncbi:MAG: hypothetical protein IJS88_01010 [Alphaproteobacteria bacterium]|nr:hypothetical protein [Alphaproteobacteria bacterium]
MTEVNREYQPLVDYLTGIMHKLQKQSQDLKDLDISLCLSDAKENTDNAYCYLDYNTISIGLKYLKKVAQYGEDAAASVIAHELSHLIYQKKYNLYGASKETEIFCDNYGVILRHRAGYNTSVNMRMKELEADMNVSDHPQDAIRRLIMRRTASALDTANKPITPFKCTIPEGVKLTETIDNIKKNKEKNKSKHVVEQLTDTQIKNNNKTAANNINKMLMTNLLMAPSLTEMHKSYLRRLDLNDCAAENVLQLYEKVSRSPAMKDDYGIMMQFRNQMINQALVNADELENRKLMTGWNEKILERIKIEPHHTPEHLRDALRKFLDIRFRFSDKEKRTQLYEMYAKSFVQQYGTDDGSSAYGEKLEKDLSYIKGKIHNADVIPFAKTLKKQLELKDRNIPILQNFVKQNSFDLMSIRAETLITECLLIPEQALQTVKYLTGISNKAFQFEGIYDKKSGAVEPSYITANSLRDIRDDMADIAPSKRAAVFSLLMENIPAENSMRKLEMFVDKKTTEDEVYKSVLQTYFNTYPANQQPYVVASLVSFKDIGKPFGYEDYFKELLLHSGIEGRRVYDTLYQTKFSTAIETIYSNSTAIKDENSIVFANLQAAGQLLRQEKSPELKRIGEKIVNTTRRQPYMHTGIERV